jgi:von Willebrand factor type A domain
MEGAAALSNCTEVTAPQFPTLLVSKAHRLALLLALVLCVILVPRAEAFQLFWIDDNGAHHEVTGAAGSCPLQPKSHPVLFVHGHPLFGQSGSGPNYQRNWIDGSSFHAALAIPENAGLDIEDYYIEFLDSGRSILEDANRVGDAIALVQNCQDPANATSVRIAVVGYSKGTISTRVYLRSRAMAGQGQDLGSEYPGDVALTPHSPNFNPVSEFIALASPNHGLRLFSTSLPIQQLGNGVGAVICTPYSDSRAADFLSKLNGLTPSNDWSGAHETPANRANGAPVTDGTLFVSIYDDDDPVGGTLPDSADCATPKRKQAFNRGANAQNIQLNVGDSSNAHQNTVKDFEVICRALYTLVHHRAPPAVSTSLCDSAPSGAPIIPDGTAVVLALDHSGSMGIPACPGCATKQEVLRQAAEMFVATWQALAAPHDRIGATYFRTGIDQFAAAGSGDTTVPLLPDVSALLADLQSEATNSSGLTAMGGALQTSIEVLQGTDPPLRRVGPNRHVILFTDGLQNVNPKIQDDANQQLILANAPGFVDAGIPVTLTGPISGQNVTVDTIGIGVSPASQALLEDLSVETGGVSRFSVDTAVLNQFFTMTLVDTLRDSSPQLIAYRSGTLAGDEQAEVFTVNAGVKQIVLRLSWTGGAALDFRVEKDGTDLTADGKWTAGGFYRIFALDLPANVTGGPLDPAGAWRMVIRGRPGTTYEAAAIVDEPQLDYRATVGPGDHVVGTPLVLEVSLSLQGRPVDGADVTATVLRPADSIGNLLVAFPYRAAPPGQAFEPLTSLGQRAAMTALQDEAIWRRLQPESQAVTLEEVGPGRYRATVAQTAVAGLYTVNFRIEIDDPQLGVLQRAHSTSLPLRVGNADFESSGVRLVRLASSKHGREVELRLTPRDRLGNYFGPDQGDLIAVKSSAALRQSALHDLGNGSYAIPLILPADGDPELSLTIAGAPLFAGPVSLLEPSGDAPAEDSSLILWIALVVGWTLALVMILRLLLGQR